MGYSSTRRTTGKNSATMSAMIAGGVGTFDVTKLALKAEIDDLMDIFGF